ncbi:PREDICTED: ankyrin repeat domain-containing protein 33 isoform X2 [Chinchilla lanigera]|uniref:ankyrin repeat domain-containing protein 33 isoform X2 n=1 Tax=Chinchilla lanigera TaxID=34839 RepID=UPI0006991378|nr:PREDICTED: ankyrin repeat domain-containing protein 33 isoform X2 [Chinchilla lanigera]
MSEGLSCPGKETPGPGCRLGALYWACAHNNPVQLQAVLDAGVSPEEATQVDSNGRTGLMVACYRGFKSIVALLSRCPFLDVNQQDKDGDTALMLAVQAGADLTSVDPVRGKTALEWALLTDSFDVVWRIRQLLRRPCAEQLSQHYQLEWPALRGLVAQAQAQATPSFLERLQANLSLSSAQCPQEGGVLDHFVTITTSLASPFLATACHSLCPDHPPTLGTRSRSVPELLGTAPPPPLSPQPPQVVSSSQVFVPYNPQGMFSQWLQPRNSTSSPVPKILLSKAPSSPSQFKLMLPRYEGRQSLALPLWQYQELRMQRKRQEEEARKAQN